MKKVYLILGAAGLMLTACNSGTSSGETATSTDSGSVPVQEFPANQPVTGQVDSTKITAPTADSMVHVNKDEKRYSNENGEIITAVYHNSDDMGVAELNINGTSVKLMKGNKKEGAVIYTNGKMTWAVKEHMASLEKDNVVTEYKEKE